jgi:hypothetical protein
MARKPLNVSSTAGFGIGVDNSSGQLFKAAIGIVKSNGTIDPSTITPFLLNPDSWEETIETNWVAHNIPGNSPVYQWVSGGPRALTFDALVTKDTSEFLNAPPKALDALKNTAINAVGSIACNFLGVNLPPIQDLLSTFDSAGSGEDLGISTTLDFYRSLLYPMYVDGKIDSNPPLLALYTGKTFDNQKTYPGESVNSNMTVWILTNLKIHISKQLPNLTPMEALVSFKLLQYPFKSIGQDAFTKASGLDTSKINASLDLGILT